MLLLILLFNIMGCSQDHYVSYNSSKGYSFQYAENTWEVKENENQTFLFNKQDLNQRSVFNTNLNILIQDLSGSPLSLEEYHLNTLEQIEQALGKNAIKKEREVEIFNIKGKEIIYVMPKNIAQQRGQTLKLKQVYFLHNKKAYLITYTARLNDFEKYLPYSQKVFESFTIK